MNGMISHANGDASWHREQRGIKTPEQKRIKELESMGVTEACAELPPVMEYFQQCEKRIEMLLEDCIEYCKRIEFLESQLAEFKRDAERWREYQARKIRLTEAGFGKSPLRDAAKLFKSN